MKTFLTSLTLLFLISYARATTIHVGTGSGGFALTTTYTMGDTVAIKYGTYGSLSMLLQNQNGIVVIPDSGDVIITGSNYWELNTVSNLTITSFGGHHFIFNNVSNSAFYLSSNNTQGLYINDVKFINVSGIVFDASGYYTTYNGNVNTLKIYRAAFTHCKFTSCNQIFQGSFLTAAALTNIMDSIAIGYDTCVNITNNGNGWNGVVTRFNCYNDLVTYAGQNYQVNDVGYFSFTGYGQVHDCVINGGRGWLIRNFLCAMTAAQGDTYIYNNIKYRTTNYGLVDVRCDSTMYGSYFTKSNFHIFNNTMANCIDTAYLAPIAVIYQMDAGAQGDVKNNFGTNLKLGAGNWLTSSFGDPSGNFMWATDTASNLYTTNPVPYLQDTNAYFRPTSSSYLNTHGVVEALAVPDIYGYTGSGNRIGAAFYQSGNTPPSFGAGTKTTIQLPLDSARTGNVATAGTCRISGYSWSQISGPNTATITTASLDSSWFKNLITGTYIFQNTVNDTCSLSASVQDTIIVLAANTPPTFGGGTNTTITLPLDSLRTGNVATAGTCRILSYAWSQISGPNTATIVTASADSSWFKNLIAGTYIFQLTVNDTCSLSATVKDTIIVHAATGSCPCIAFSPFLRHAWAPRSGPYYSEDDIDSLPTCIKPVITISHDTAVNLSAGMVAFFSSAVPENGSPISSYMWQEISGPTATLVGDSSQDVTVEFNTAGSYIFQVQAKDACGAFNTAQVTLTVNNPVDTAIGTSPGFEVEIYPNPANTSITELIKGKTNGTVEINIYNLQGRNLATLSTYKSSSSISESLNVSKFTPGTYVIKTTINRSKPVSVKFEIVR